LPVGAHFDAEAGARNAHFHAVGYDHEAALGIPGNIALHLTSSQVNGYAALRHSRVRRILPIARGANRLALRLFDLQLRVGRQLQVRAVVHRDGKRLPGCFEPGALLHRNVSRVRVQQALLSYAWQPQEEDQRRQGRRSAQARPPHGRAPN
jgi:hypothetical protein